LAQQMTNLAEIEKKSSERCILKMALNTHMQSKKVH
jgi:hypothetical protein